MFREVARINKRLTKEECVQLLKNEKRGVMSLLGDDDYPLGVPLNYWYCEEENRLYFHGGRKGHRVDAMKKHDKASFCVYDAGFRREGEWALNIKSVIVFGRIEFVDDQDTVYRLSEELSRKFTDDDTYIKREIEQAGPRTLMFALVPEHITGKIVNES